MRYWRYLSQKTLRKTLWFYFIFGNFHFQSWYQSKLVLYIKMIWNKKLSNRKKKIIIFFLHLNYLLDIRFLSISAIFFVFSSLFFKFSHFYFLDCRNWLLLKFVLFKFVFKFDRSSILLLIPEIVGIIGVPLFFFEIFSYLSESIKKIIYPPKILIFYW